jgi:hypothetical protein
MRTQEHTNFKVYGKPLGAFLLLGLLALFARIAVGGEQTEHTNFKVYRKAEGVKISQYRKSTTQSRFFA